MSDEIIAEVRAVKDALAAQHNYNLRSLFVAIKKEEAELEASGVRVVPPPLSGSSQQSTALQRTRFGRRRE
jgi:hypothetical protein